MRSYPIGTTPSGRTPDIRAICKYYFAETPKDSKMMNKPRVGIAANLSPPFFIVGCPRSGTTLVERILGSHSRLAVYFESHYYTIFHPFRHRYGDLGRLPNLVRLISDVREVIRVQGSMDPPDVEQFLEALVAPTFAGVMATFLHLYARQQGKARSGDKTPTHFRYLKDIMIEFPTSPVIYVIRDPRDTVCSIHDALGIGLHGAVWNWNEAFLTYVNLSRPVHLVRYEELIQRPREVVEALCGFLKEGFEPQMLRFFERIPRVHLTLPEHRRLLEPIGSESLGRFRQMPSHQVKWIEAACAAGMEAMGYPFSAEKPSPLQLSAPTKLTFVLDRLRYYGLSRQRWRRGWMRWKILLRVSARYLLVPAVRRSLL
jgi:hypothetical protein